MGKQAHLSILEVASFSLIQNAREKLLRFSTARAFRRSPTEKVCMVRGR